MAKHAFEFGRFELGRLVATPAARETLEELGVAPHDLIERHVRGDWGDLDDDDIAANEQALADGSRILSAYEIEGTKFWVITEAVDDNGSRGSTCIMLPEEY
jgi:hypothetical protein